MTSPFLSIIISVYNGLKTGLPKCLDCIWNQPLSTDLYEVIVVEDCSTDGTRQWLHEQEKLHPNMHVIDNEVNIRVGGSRNRGVREAKGKYFIFLDADDYYHPGSLEKVYRHLLEHPELDVLVTDSAWQYVGQENNKLQLNLPYEGVCTGVEFLLKNGPTCVPWRFAINRAFYTSHNIQFVERTRIEDLDWSPKLFFYAQKVQYIKVILVHYNQGNSGATDTMYRNMDTLKSNILTGCRALEVANTLYVGNPAYPIVANMGESNFNSSCKYLFGSYQPIATKKEIIKLISVKNSKFPLVNFAIHHPTLFSMISNMGVIPFRIVRYLRRKKKAQKLAGK